MHEPVGIVELPQQNKVQIGLCFDGVVWIVLKGWINRSGHRKTCNREIGALNHISAKILCSKERNAHQKALKFPPPAVRVLHFVQEEDDGMEGLEDERDDIWDWRLPLLPEFCLKNGQKSNIKEGFTYGEI
jgi:hypothetical protein